MTGPEIVEANPLLSWLESRGVEMRGTGKSRQTHRCPEIEHKRGHFCVNVDGEKQLWHCHDCKVGGTVIDWLMRLEAITAAEAMNRLGGTNGHARQQNAPRATERAPNGQPAPNGAKPKMVKAYDYVDEDGKLLFQVCRFEPKDFRQRAPDGSGGWIYKLEGIRRTLYNLPAVIEADLVFICEGEKDADTMADLKVVATTNCGGAEKWLPEYTAALRGKEVVILPDSDPAGEKHLDKIRDALGKVTKSMRIVAMPHGIKDLTEWRETFETAADFSASFFPACERAEVLYRGESVPIQTMEELESDYREHVKKAATHQLDLGNWLPALRYKIRPVVPGEIVALLAGTGVGKTMVLQNIALNANLATLMFETELPGTLSFERFAAMATKSTGAHVESCYRVNGSVPWKLSGKLNHIVCCHKSRLTTDEIGRIIVNSELKTCRRPVLVLIDYIQLVQGTGDSRYERISCVAEQLKVVAKETGTIIVVASQINRSAAGRGEDEAREVCLTDGKDSGSIENSSGVVLGCWRDPSTKGRIMVKVLKNTKGGAGTVIPCQIQESLLIHQESTEAEPEPRNYQQD